MQRGEAIRLFIPNFTSAVYGLGGTGFAGRTSAVLRLEICRWLRSGFALLRFFPAPAGTFRSNLRPGTIEELVARDVDMGRFPGVLGICRFLFGLRVFLWFSAALRDGRPPVVRLFSW